MEGLLGFFRILTTRTDEVLLYLFQHIQLSLISLGIAVAISVPLGIFLTRHKKIADPVIGLTAIVQTIPSLALLGFLIPILGISMRPAIVALTIYGLLPILRNTYTGIVNVDPAIIDAGRGMGMTDKQILFKVQLPLALSVIVAGIRTSTVLIIGVATLASLAGAGGMGEFIFRGISTSNDSLILAGAIPAALLAIAFDYGIKKLEWITTPRGLRK
ncbi:ABC transporter permease [Anaerobranca gottschalkii]|uniref:Osmoprotectant transport system permease protein n=1 Tax=Anaerobranca gottschalkii DSM 13577 TaxID=1120990 RepID=A0A1H9YQQ0_9FIRM|nr:ABC transporter permease [Anaerobranca gottschalkii]SES71407.1 osmoprotectant transport system permease protein [Anaerobranca gottschalkii DSM 13577]